MVLTQYNIRPVFDVQADVQGRDLASVAPRSIQVIQANQPPASIQRAHRTRPDRLKPCDPASPVWPAEWCSRSCSSSCCWRSISRAGLDPLIVLMAVPFALAGVIWMLYLTHTHISVPALMGTLMCIGLTTANSTLVVAFANQRRDGRGRCADRRHRRRVHAASPGGDDRRRDGPGHDPHGAWASAKAANRTPRWPARSSAGSCSPPSPRWSSSRQCIVRCGRTRPASNQTGNMPGFDDQNFCDDLKRLQERRKF